MYEFYSTNPIPLGDGRMVTHYFPKNHDFAKDEQREYVHDPVADAVNERMEEFKLSQLSTGPVRPL